MVVDSNVTQNGTVFILLLIPFAITCVGALGKFLFDDGLLFVNHFFGLRSGKKNSKENENGRSYQLANVKEDKIN